MEDTLTQVVCMAGVIYFFYYIANRIKYAYGCLRHNKAERSTGVSQVGHEGNIQQDYPEVGQLYTNKPIQSPSLS